MEKGNTTLIFMIIIERIFKLKLKTLTLCPPTQHDFPPHIMQDVFFLSTCVINDYASSREGGKFKIRDFFMQ